LRFEVFENQNPRPRPPRPPWLRAATILFWVVIGLLVLLGLAIHLIAEYIWMGSLGFADVFSTIFLTKLLLGVLGFLLFAIPLFFALYGIRRVYLNMFETQGLPSVLTGGKWFFWVNLAVSGGFGLIGSGFARGIGWERFLTFFNQVPFGIQDPLFGKDISFYIFTLPFLNFLIGMLLGLFVVLSLIQAAAFSVFQLYLRERSAQIQLSISVIMLGVLLALHHLLAPYETLLSNNVNVLQQSVVYGASFTDRVINIPMGYVMAGVSLLAAVLVLAALYKRRIRLLFAAPILYFGVLLAGQAASVAVQSFIVTPNEFAREKPFLQHNLNMTRVAHGIDQVKEAEHPGNLSLSAEMLQRNRLTIENVRINDPRPLLDVYNQLQTFRTYYEFLDVDVDRYWLDGKYQQVFLAARELNIKNLPDQSKTWTNQTLRYTHGYGIAMSHVNQVTSQGQPEYMVKDLPPQGTVEVKRPQIYFGEQDYQNVVVNTKVDEFDYPAGETNVSHRFEANTGIPMTRLNRLIFAWEEMSPRIFISGQIDANSQLLRKRNIMDRLQSIAPFLHYDKDPYLVVRDDGTLVWIVDAYTTSGRYPYSEPVARGINYIKNPVKAVIDAYTGEVHFYLIDPDEPLVKVYRAIFPNLFETEIPEDIRRHFRYPETLFTYQAKIYQTYHMTNLEVFYNREDFWQFATENYYESDTPMEPYYITMKLPDEEKEEFVLMLPFTPNKRQNMIAWMAARNDGEHYGELLVYRFPKQKTIYGPQQIENRINQNAQISQQLNLWSQGGSRVIRGNMLVIPIEDTLLYLEPLYIESSNETSLPEVKQIILSYGDYIVMESTFEQAMERLLELVNAGKPPAETGPGQAPGAPLVRTADELLQEFADLFKRYQEAMAAGKWSEAGRIMESIQARIQQWQQQKAGQENKPAPGSAPAAGGEGGQGATPAPGPASSPAGEGGLSPAEQGEAASGGQ